MNEFEHDLFLRVMGLGVEKCAERLSRICRSPWKLEKLAVGAEAAELLVGLMAQAQARDDHFGSYHDFPQAAFLVLFDRRSALRVGTRFTSPLSDVLDVIDKAERAALAEVCNILINALTDVVAETCNRTIVLSAPIPHTLSPAELIKEALHRSRAEGEKTLACYMRLDCPELSSACTLIALMDAGLLKQ